MFPISSTLKLLQVAAPPNALDAILRWVEGIRGQRGRATLDVTLVGLDGQWEELQVHREPERYRRRA